MPSRYLAALIAIVMLAGSAGLAGAQYQMDERQQMLSGGAAKRGNFNLFGWTGGGDVTRTSVNFSSNHKPGTIVINTAERKLYLVQAGGTALRYGIGVGRVGFTWKGVRKVTEKREWPSWTPPPQMLKRRPDLPRHMVGGEDNPLGARAMYLGGTLYRIHGSNEPETIGQAVSSGCFRMTNDDVKDLYERVSVGATVIVQ
jgi:lipoprotein-anchoring transpeptidase ErfK/SrfK